MRRGASETRVAALRRGRAKGSGEALRVQKLLPGGLVVGIGQTEVPGDESDLLADIGRLYIGGILDSRGGLEELRRLVPEMGLDKRFDLSGFVAIGAGEIAFASCSAMAAIVRASPYW